MIAVYNLICVFGRMPLEFGRGSELQEEVIHRGEEINLQQLKCKVLLSHVLFSFSSQKTKKNVLFSFSYFIETRN